MDSIINTLLKDAFNETGKDFATIFNHKLEEYGLSRRKACKLLGVDNNTLEGILNGTAKQPSLTSALKIAQFLEIDIQEIISHLLSTQNSDNIASIVKADKATFIAKNFDLKKLTKVGIFKNEDTDDTEVISEKLMAFFGLNDIKEFDRDLTQPLYSKSKRSFTDKMKTFWIVSAYEYFKNINNPHPYDRDAVKELVPKIKPYCQDVEDGLFIVCKALYNAGVTVIIQEQLVTTQIRGATFVVNDKPCIVLTDLFKRYTTLWFTLIHEIYHVIFDIDKIAQTKFHLTGDPDLFLMEDKADNFSREYFFGESDFRQISPLISNPFVVAKFAKENEIHPSFIYSTYQYFQQELYGKNFYGAYLQYFPDYRTAVKGLNPINWQEEKISEKAALLKKIFELN